MLFFFFLCVSCQWASQVALMVKKLPANTRDIRDSRFEDWVGKTAWMQLKEQAYHRNPNARELKHDVAMEA